jgi:hypothetical protein
VLIDQKEKRHKTRVALLFDFSLALLLARSHLGGD